MELKLTAPQVAEDLCMSNDTAIHFGYAANEDGTIVAEQYGDDGEIIATYSVTMTITETTGGQS